jgi:YwiC-like protein
MTRRSLLPREHGAYFQLVIPLAAAAFSQAPGIAGASLMAASGLAFLAHEPMLILLGARGQRLRSAEGRRARGWFAALAGSAVVLGAIGLVVAPTATCLVAAPALAAGAALVVAATRRSEHTLGGELVAAVALTGAASVARVASGAAVQPALLQWLGWVIGFSASVIAVHRVIARHKRPATLVDRLASVGLCAGAALLIATATRYPTSTIAAPLVLLAAGVVTMPPPARRLRAVGVAIAVTAAFSAALDVAAARGYF